MALDDKAEIRKQWNSDPCGAETAAASVPESRDWYESVRQNRYERYAPWLPALMDAPRWQGARVLEIGVGLGSDHLTFAEAGARMHALDLSAEHLRHTGRNLALHGLSGDQALGDAERNPWRDASFDLVYSFGVLHHTPGTERAIAEVLRVLRPGGTALIALYHRDSWFYWLRTILYRGVFGLLLLRRGRRRMLSEIEYRSAGNEALPLVKVYSRAQCRELFSGFQTVRMSAHCVTPTHFIPPLSWLMRAFTPQRLERWFGFGGWYLVIRATKAG
jgi:SAM-dependent methyltransferase